MYVTWLDNDSFTTLVIRFSQVPPSQCYNLALCTLPAAKFQTSSSKVGNPFSPVRVYNIIRWWLMEYLPNDVLYHYQCLRDRNVIFVPYLSIWRLKFAQFVIFAMLHIIWFPRLYPVTTLWSCDSRNPWPGVAGPGFLVIGYSTVLL